MFTAAPAQTATAKLHAALAPAASDAVELRAGTGDDGRLFAFPQALQGSVADRDAAPVKPALAAAAQPARREGHAEASVDAAGATGDDADQLLAELNVRHALRTRIAPEDPTPTSQASGGKPPLVRPRPLVPTPGDVVPPPSRGDDAVLVPPFHDQPRAPMPRDAGAEAAQAVSGTAEIQAPHLGAGLNTTHRSSRPAEAVKAGGDRAASDLTGGQQVRSQTVAAQAPSAPTTAAQPAPWPGLGQETASSIEVPQVPQVMAANDNTARPANEAGSTAFALSLPMGQAAPLAGMSAASAGPMAEARLMATPGSADFSSQLGAQLTTFVREGVQQARLHLHPAELGPVTVRIQMEGQAAQVHMWAEHALTRQALEQSMPLLAGSLREAGLTLGGGGVFEQPRQREGGDVPRQPGLGSGNAPGSEQGPETPQHAASAAPARRGVVDLVA